MQEALKSPELQKRIAQAKELAQQNSNDDEPKRNKPSDTAECPDCGGTGAALYKKEVTRADGNVELRDFFKPCSCAEQKKLERRFQNALIPEEFEEAGFKQYERKTEVQKTLFNATFQYMEDIDTILKEKPKVNSLGFIAVYGESEIRNMDPAERYSFKQAHNNFGLGKTHLQMALARYIIENIRVRDELSDGSLSKHDRGCQVLCVSDVVFMEDLIQAKMSNDEGKKLQDLIRGACNADVLVWDDLGKAKWSESKEGMYYQIINERWRHKRPIIFSSNEAKGSLSDKIGYAASSRLFGMTGKENLYEVEGQDYRLREDE
ncbi:DnaA ATPase domain-containing protein [Salimicrobium jeotgali]|uniref:DnaA ATPase domain-containing protein n=1 Tax=Salimicrobium jeotgali TaxID=1230341 RepID=UPI001ED9AB67|nr:DnaA/Hda family protein [Salimicrobium jeotgali]